jgi:hypothetical protein
MTEKLLHNPQVSTSVQHVGSESMPQGVRMCRRRRASIDYATHIPRPQPRTPPVKEEGTICVLAACIGSHQCTRPAKPFDQRLTTLAVHRYPAFLATLAKNTNDHRGKIDVTQPKTAKLCNTQAAAVKKLQHGIISSC